MAGGYRERKHIARVIEVNKLFEALDVAIVKELFLEVRARSLGGGTLRGRHRRISRSRSLHSAVPRRRKLCPIRIRIRPGTESASEERPDSQVPVTEAKGIRDESEGVGRRLVEEGIPGIQRHAKIRVAKASEQWTCIRGCAGVGAIRSLAFRRRRRRRRGPAVQMARVAVRLPRKRLYPAISSAVIV